MVSKLMENPPINCLVSSTLCSVFFFYWLGMKTLFQGGNLNIIVRINYLGWREGKHIFRLKQWNVQRWELWNKIGQISPWETSFFFRQILNFDECFWNFDLHIFKNRTDLSENMKQFFFAHKNASKVFILAIWMLTYQVKLPCVNL